MLLLFLSHTGDGESNGQPRAGQQKTRMQLIFLAQLIPPQPSAPSVPLLLHCYFLPKTDHNSTGVPGGPCGLYFPSPKPYHFLFLFWHLRVWTGKEASHPPSSLSLPDGKQSKLILTMCLFKLLFSRQVTNQLNLLLWWPWLHSWSFNLQKIPTCLLHVKPCLYLLRSVPEPVTIYSFHP